MTVLPTGTRSHRRIRPKLLATTALVGVSFALAAATPASAQTYTWTGAVDGNYLTAGNWSGGAAPPPDTNTEIAIFGIGGINTNITVGAATTVNSWSFIGTTGYLLSGAEITLDGTGVVSSSSGDSIANNLTGTGGVTVNGPNSLVLLGNNTYTGATVVNAGGLNIVNASALGSTASGTTVASGASLSLLNGIAVGNEALSLAGTLFSGNGDNSFGGQITLTGNAFIRVEPGRTLSLLNLVTGAGGLTEIEFGTLNH